MFFVDLIFSEKDGSREKLYRKTCDQAYVFIGSRNFGGVLILSRGKTSTHTYEVPTRFRGALVDIKERLSTVSWFFYVFYHMIRVLLFNSEGDMTKAPE